MLHSEKTPVLRAAVRVAGLSAAGAVGALMSAPLAQAQPSAAAASTTPTTPAPGAGQATSAAPAPVGRMIAPNYGFQKIRVGVEVKAGAVVPAGTSLAGAKLRVVTDAVTSPLPVPGGDVTCTTSATGLCDTGYQGSFVNGAYLLAPGQTATVTQLTAPTGLAASTTAVVHGPCLQADCNLDSQHPTPVLLDDSGPLPVAIADKAKVVDGSAVSIAVLVNDTANAPVTKLTAAQPRHGSVTVKAGAVRYVPVAHFSGTDTFDYTVTTANGSATASVTVLVAAAPTPTPTPTSSAPVTPSPSSTAEPASASTTDPGLASTGASTGLPLGWGAGLAGAGVLAMVGARRRTVTGSHSGRRH